MITAQLPLQNRRIVRGQIDPMDISTVVSIYPKTVDDKKPTLIPGRWIIPGGRYDNPTLFHVGASCYYHDYSEEAPILEVPVPSIQIARSIVTDYNNGILECDMGDRMPGLFVLPGKIIADELKKKYLMQLNSARDKQNNWFNRLVDLGDSFWARSNGNPLSITDDMRLAARELGRLDKSWVQAYVATQQIKCVYCGALRDPNFPICGSCHKVVDVARMIQLDPNYKADQPSK